MIRFRVLVEVEIGGVVVADDDDVIGAAKSVDGIHAMAVRTPENFTVTVMKMTRTRLRVS